MNRTTRFFMLGLATLSASTASAAIFDSLESVDQLKIIAEQRTVKTDRMPAGKAAEPTKEDETSESPAPAAKE